MLNHTATSGEAFRLSMPDSNGKRYRTLQFLYQKSEWLNSHALVVCNLPRQPHVVRVWAEAIIGFGC